MRRLALLLVLSFRLSFAAAEPMLPNAASYANWVDPYATVGSVVVIAWHETRDDVRDYPDPYAVDAAALVRQFAWLHSNGYTPVSLDQIVSARAGGNPLPTKAVLLTFDDAYQSFYTRVYPLLRAFAFPAVLGVVGKWIDDPHSGSMLYGEKGAVTDARFPTWTQLREMADSGLVELASHTYDLHHGIRGNPQGNLQPAATTRTYDAATARYEDDESWRRRVRDDLTRNVEAIWRETGRRPRIIVWPYGSYNEELVAIAGTLGMTIGLTLNDGPATPNVPLTAIPRTLVAHNPSLAEFVAEVRGPRHPVPVRVMQIRLDDVFSADPVRQESNLSRLLDRVLILQPTHVYLVATADSNSDGLADMSYFPTRHLPLRADLFNRAAWQLASRIELKIFAVMPLTVSGVASAAMTEVYADLARYASFDGLVFDDERPAGATEAAGILEYTKRLAQAARKFHAPLASVRMINNDSRPVGSQVTPSIVQLAALAASYDFLALVATPGHDGSFVLPDSAALRKKLVFMLRSGPSAAGGTTRDTVAQQMRSLQLEGILNFGVVPDDFLHDNPPLDQLAPAMSLREYPLAVEAKKP